MPFVSQRPHCAATTVAAFLVGVPCLCKPHFPKKRKSGDNSLLSPETADFAVFFCPIRRRFHGHAEIKNNKRIEIIPQCSFNFTPERQAI